VKCVLLSLAKRYKKGIDGLNRLLPEPVEVAAPGMGGRGGRCRRTAGAWLPGTALRRPAPERGFFPSVV